MTIARLFATALALSVTAGTLAAQRGAVSQPAGGGRASSPAASNKSPDPPAFDLGQPAPPELIAAWDTDVTPDGQGLPAGRGTARTGAGLYLARCAVCHGAKGEGAQFDPLVGTESRAEFGFGKNPAIPKTIGNYWPYATTLFDYIRRAMPQPTPGILSADETYSVTAYLLFLNGLVDENAEMNRETLPNVVMPARDRFVRDNRTGGRVIR